MEVVADDLFKKNKATVVRQRNPSFTVCWDFQADEAAPAICFGNDNSEIEAEVADKRKRMGDVL